MIPSTRQRGTNIPLIGLGTWLLNGKECENTIAEALEIGYRHIDTAGMYENHHEIGRAIRSFPRHELFLTSKLNLNDLTKDKVKETVLRFLNELDVDYLDLLLIHWPNDAVPLDETFEAMIAMKDSGAAHNLGVSNFVTSHLEALTPYKAHIVTNQIEVHPFLQRKKLIEAYRKHGINITAYRPLAKGAIENDPVLQNIGYKNHKTASQIALRWLIQNDIVAIPKATSRKHLKDNFDIFDFCLTQDEMEYIEQLDRGQRFCIPAGMSTLED